MQTLRLRDKSGFTVMEILVAVSIIAIMAGLAVPAYFRTVEVGRSNEARTNLNIIHMGQKVYRLNNGTYWNDATPTAGETNAALNIDMTVQNYDLTLMTGAANNYQARFTRNAANGGGGTKTFTATYPDPADPLAGGVPSMPPLITEGGAY